MMELPVTQNLSATGNSLVGACDCTTADLTGLATSLMTVNHNLASVIADAILSLIPLRMGWNEIMQLDRDIHALAGVLATKMTGGVYDLHQHKSSKSSRSSKGVSS
jgi:hypothetical protein